MARVVTPEKTMSNKQVAEKVKYELAMFQFLYGELREIAIETATFAPNEIEFLGTGLPDHFNGLRTNALLESFLLHTRVLHDFFYKERTQDDIVATEFVPEWKSECPPKGEYLSSRLERLNKALAHLSRKRLTYETDDKSWDIGLIKQEVDVVIRTFLDKLPLDRRQWFAYKVSDVGELE